MPPPKFNVGDRVRLVRPDSPGAYRIGQTGTVTRVSRHARPGDNTDPVTTWYDVRFESAVVRNGRNFGNIPGLHREQELEPIRRE
jgi:hypothetical protein